MRPGLRGDSRAALAAFDGLEYVNRLGIAARAHTPAGLDALLAPLGWRPDRWFGVRIFSDHRDAPVHHVRPGARRTPRRRTGSGAA
jgi:S-adenosylmethionine-dependent methyltransferase